jgi:nucleoside phosphorylase
MNVAEILVAVPQAKELDPLLGALVAAGQQPRKLILGRLECHLFEELRLLFAVGGHGKAQFAVRTQHLLEQKPGFQVVICAGAAGGLRDDLELGDVVVGVSTIEHDYKVRRPR